MKFNKSQLFKLKKALLKLSEIATEEGVVLITDSEEITSGLEVFVDGDEGLTPASDGTYTYGNQLITVEGGVITVVAEKGVEEQPVEEQPVEEQPVEEETSEEEEQPAETEEEQPAETEEEQPTEEEEQPAETEEVDVEALRTRIAELEALVAELEAKLAEPVAESVEEEMRKTEKPENNTMNYLAAIKKAREINIKRK